MNHQTEPKELFDGWMEVTQHDGQKYYFNPSTQEASYEMPVPKSEKKEETENQEE